MKKYGAYIILTVFFFICFVIPSMAEEKSVYHDSQTGLEWLPGPDRATNWQNAKSWIEDLGNYAGGGWRMPTMKELKTIYNTKREGRSKVPPQIETTGCRVWSCDCDKGSYAWLFDYSYGGEYRLPLDCAVTFSRVLAVRSGGD